MRPDSGRGGGARVGESGGPVQAGGDLLEGGGGTRRRWRAQQDEDPAEPEPEGGELSHHGERPYATGVPRGCRGRCPRNRVVTRPHRLDRVGASDKTRQWRRGARRKRAL